MTEIGATCKLCGLMVHDKLTGAHETQEYLTSVLEEPIITPCRRRAEVYGCDFNTTGFLDSLKAVNADSAEIEAYALGGLALEAAFLKQTIAALTSTLGSVVARLSATFGSGVACTAADGPFPFGDAVAVVLAVGGTAWSSYDLYEARSCIVRAAELGVINSCDILPVFHEFKSPSHIEFKELTRWSLMNALTEIVKKYPVQRVDHSYLALNRAFGLDGRKAALFA